MQSIINHLSNSAQLALEGSLYYKRELHFIKDYEVTFIADIKQNLVFFELNFDNRKGHAFSITTDKLWTYNSAPMAKATVEFLLCQLLFKVYNDPHSWDDIALVKELQSRFKEAFDVQISIY